MHDGSADLFTWYDCVGKSSGPCDENNSLELVVEESGSIFQPSQVLVHITDPAGRTASSKADDDSLVWSTGHPSFTNFSERAGVIIRDNTTDLSRDEGWGVDDTLDPNSKFGRVTTAVSGPGDMSVWYEYSNDIYPLFTVPTSSAELYYLELEDEIYAEFTRLGTYKFTLTAMAAHSGGNGDCDTDGDDTNDGFCDTETYTFHIGPMQDLEVLAGSGASAGQTVFTIRATNNGPDREVDATVKVTLPAGALVEDYVASEGTYSNGVWTLPGLKLRDYRRSQGKPEAAALSLILKEGGGVPQKPATATISFTDNSYTVCIASDRSRLAHETQADCKADAKTTDTWHSAVCVKDADQTVNTSATHNTQALCTALAGHTWTANVCASSTSKVIANRTEAECDGWHTGTVYDYNSANNTAKIMAVEGTGIGPDIPANVATQTGATIVMWDEVEYLYSMPVARYQLQWLGGDWTMLDDAVIENEFVDAAPTGRRAYRVRAVNAAGVAGPWSRSSVQAALGSPGPPQNVSARADGNNAIDVSWASPEDAGNSPVTGYRVEWTADPEEGRWSGANTTELTYKHRNLQTASTWHYRVAARNRGGLGVWSDPVMGTTAPTVPDAPGNFRATTLSDYEIELTWNEPKDNGEPITGYQLERSRDGSADSWSQRATPGADATAHTDSSLDANTRYYYRVRAVNSVGAGAWSRSISAMTQLTPPDAPSLTSVEADGPNAIIVTWAEPFFLGDLPITHYQVQWAKDPYSTIWRGPQTVSGSARSWRHTGLKPDETWHYQVRASNGGGRWSVWSYISAATTASEKVPTAAPSGLTATYDAADGGSVTLKWNTPSGSAEITGYDLQYSEDNSQWENLEENLDALTYTDDGYHLYPGSRVYYRVRAVAAEGAGPWSSSRSVSVPAIPPDSLRYINIHSDGSNHFEMEWEPPYYDGGLPITGYRLLWCRVLEGADDNPCRDAMEESNSPADPPGYSSISLGTSARSYTHSVSPGYEYFYLMRVTNGGNRWSEWDENDIWGWNRTYAGTPAAPSLTARAVDANQIKLTWSKPNAYGAEINQYWLYVYYDSEKLLDYDNWVDVLTIHGDLTEWTIGDLSPGTTRYFRIRALSDNGEGKHSALRQATTPSG